MASLFVNLAPVSDDALAAISRRNPGWKIERIDTGELSVSPPTHTQAGISAAGVASRASAESAKSYWTIAPDVVIEVESDTDDWSQTKAKIDQFARDGCGYAVAVDPDSREVYRVGSPPEGLVLNFDAIVDA